MASTERQDKATPDTERQDKATPDDTPEGGYKVGDMVGYGDGVASVEEVKGSDVRLVGHEDFVPAKDVRTTGALSGPAQDDLTAGTPGATFPEEDKE